MIQHIINQSGIIEVLHTMKDGAQDDYWLMSRTVHHADPLLESILTHISKLLHAIRPNKGMKQNDIGMIGKVANQLSAGYAILMKCSIMVEEDAVDIDQIEKPQMVEEVDLEV